MRDHADDIADTPGDEEGKDHDNEEAADHPGIEVAAKRSDHRNCPARRWGSILETKPLLCQCSGLEVTSGTSRTAERMSCAAKLIAGNWKMNGLRSDAITLAQGVRAGAQGMGCDLLVCPPFTVLEAVVRKWP